MDLLIETDASGQVENNINPWSLRGFLHNCLQITSGHNFDLSYVHLIWCVICYFFLWGECVVGTCKSKPRECERVLSHRTVGLNVGSEVVLRSLDCSVIGHRDNFIVSFGCRWSSDLSEPHQPGGRNFQRGSRGHTEQPWGGATHYLTAKRCPVCVCCCVHWMQTMSSFVLWVMLIWEWVCSSDMSAPSY